MASLTDQAGLARELTEYDPFGQVVRHEKYGSDFATAWYYFTGKPLDDETGLIFLGARYYNPSLGRFITPDTIVPNPADPQSLNRYSYVGNNPVNFIDPSGHKKKHHFWKNFWKSVWTGVQAVLDVAAIAVGVITGNPFLIASGTLALFNTATSGYQSKGWNLAHQIIGYTSAALAVASLFYDPAGAGGVVGQGDGEESFDLEKIVITKSRSELMGSGSAATMDSVYQAGDAAATMSEATSAGAAAGSVAGDVAQNIAGVAGIARGIIDGVSGGLEAYYGKTAKTFAKYAPRWTNGARAMRGMAGSYAGVGAILEIPKYVEILNGEYNGRISMGQAFAALTVHTGGIAAKVIGGAVFGGLGGAVGGIYGMVAGSVAGGAGVGYYWDYWEERFFRRIRLE